METIKKMLDGLFLIGLVSFMALGTIIVITQMVAVLTLNGSLATGVIKQLSKPTIIISAITGLIAYLQSYVHNWDMSD